jgi:hypothetical protein
MNHAKYNLTQQWWDREKEDLLCVNGFSMKGSDYELFYKLCLCIDRLNCEGRLRYQAALNNLYPGLSIPISAQNAGKLWTETSKRLIERGETYSFRAEPTEKGADSVNKLALERTPSVASVKNLEDFAATDAKSWTEWQKATEKRMTSWLCDGATVSLTLPSEFQWQKPNLYAVNRHLAGEESSESLWISQQLYFLFTIARKVGFRPLLYAECPVERVVQALEGVRSFGISAPICYASTAPLTQEELIALCRTIEGNGEGIRPVYLLLKPTEQVQFLGTFGDISVILRDP